MATPRRAPVRKRAVKPAPKSLPEIVKEGDHRASLLALRDHLAERLLSADKDAAPIARQLTIVLRELEALPNPAVESKVDEIAKRRAARRAKAAGSQRSAEG